MGRQKENYRSSRAAGKTKDAGRFSLLGMETVNIGLSARSHAPSKLLRLIGAAPVVSNGTQFPLDLKVSNGV